MKICRVGHRIRLSFKPMTKFSMSFITFPSEWYYNGWGVWRAQSKISIYCFIRCNRCGHSCATPLREERGGSTIIRNFLSITFLSSDLGMLFVVPLTYCSVNTSKYFHSFPSLCTYSFFEVGFNFCFVCAITVQARAQETVAYVVRGNSGTSK